MKALLNNHHGLNLLNLSLSDLEMIEIFGKEDMMTGPYRTTIVYDLEKEETWIWVWVSSSSLMGLNQRAGKYQKTPLNLSQ